MALEVSASNRRSSVTLQAATSACVATITTRGLANRRPAKPLHTHTHLLIQQSDSHYVAVVVVVNTQLAWTVVSLSSDRDQ